MTIIDLLQGPWTTGQVGQAGDTSSVVHSGGGSVLKCKTYMSTKRIFANF